MRIKGTCPTLGQGTGASSRETDHRSSETLPGALVGPFLSHSRMDWCREGGGGGGTTVLRPNFCGNTVPLHLDSSAKGGIR